MKTGYTIVTANYLAQAKTVANSFIAHNPDYSFVICLVDKINGQFDINDFYPHEILEVETLNISYFAEMFERYNMFELCNALKPFFAEHLYQRSSDVTIIIYLDSDIMVFDSFTYVEECLKDYAICLTPHLLSTIPEDDCQPGENGFLNAGIYNGGFFAISTDDEAKKFIRWWKKKLRHYCIVNFCEGLFVDQIWLNFVPLFFEKVFIIRHLGYNLAYWNFHERSFTNGQKDSYLISNKFPLVFFHFSGYNFNDPVSISKFQNRYSFEQSPDMLPLFQEYHRIVIANQFHKYNQVDCYYVVQKKLLEEQQRKLLEEQQRQQALIEIQRRNELGMTKRFLYAIIRRTKNKLNSSFPDI